MSYSIKQGRGQVCNEAAKAPMLAQSYEKYRTQVKFPCYWQPKLDGVRCIAYRDRGDVILLSRQEKNFPGLEHIKAHIDKTMPEDTIFDGELYRHGLAFQTLISYVKRPQKNSRLVQYHVYDINNPVEDFEKRFVGLAKKTKLSRGPVKLVATFPANSHEDIVEGHKWATGKGFEGVMVRHSGCEYKSGYRSRQLLKVKQFIDKEFKIIDAYENIGRMEGQCTFVCVTADGTKFSCKPMGTVNQRQEYWENKKKYIGKMLTVRFFSWTDSKPPVPRFPVGVAVRNYE